MIVNYSMTLKITQLYMQGGDYGSKHDEKQWENALFYKSDSFESYVY